jgi:hypothetical protein
MLGVSVLGRRIHRTDEAVRFALVRDLGRNDVARFLERRR